MLGKIKSNLQYFGLGFLIFPLGILPVPYQHEIGRILIYGSVVMAVWSAIDYFYKLRAVFVESPTR
jgi:CDP-diacylglycerol--glycerol-3-phosphate 3-phosphatidyltransferase